MKLIKTASGKRRIRISRKEWENIGTGTKWLLRDVRCEECGDLIKIYHSKGNGPILCEHCENPRVPSVGDGFTGQYHMEDDLLGGSGSWDSAVKLYEEQ